MIFNATSRSKLVCREQADRLSARICYDASRYAAAGVEILCRQFVALLENIQKRQQGFMNLSQEPRHTALVRRTLGAIDSAKHDISHRVA